MSRDKTSDLFAEGAKLYANPSIRPCYPTELFDKIYKFCGPNRGMALDVATGSGQCARELAKVFDQVDLSCSLSLRSGTTNLVKIMNNICLGKQVVAIDVSEQQIKQCNPGPNLSYQIASAERTEQPDNSVDLVTVATALHWWGIEACWDYAIRRKFELCLCCQIIIDCHTNLECSSRVKTAAISMYKYHYGKAISASVVSEEEDWQQHARTICRLQNKS